VDGVGSGVVSALETVAGAVVTVEVVDEAADVVAAVPVARAEARKIRNGCPLPSSAVS